MIMATESLSQDHSFQNPVYRSTEDHQAEEINTEGSNTGHSSVGQNHDLTVHNASEATRQENVTKRYCTCYEEIRLDGKTLKVENLKKGDYIIRPVKCGSCYYTYCCFHHAILDNAVELRSPPTRDQDQHEECGQENITDGSTQFAFLGFHQPDKNPGTCTPTINCNRKKSEFVQYNEILNFKEVDVYKLQLTLPKYENETVFKHAEDMMQSYQPYHVYFNNCEHAIRSCVTGEMASLQVDALDYCCTQLCFGWLLRLFKVILVFFSTLLDEITRFAFVDGIEMSATIVYLYILIKDLSYSCYRYNSKMMCENCYYKNIIRFVLRLVFVGIAFAAIVVHLVCQDELRFLKISISTMLSVIAVILLIIFEAWFMCNSWFIRNFTRVICTWCCCDAFNCSPCRQSDIPVRNDTQLQSVCQTPQ